MTQEGIITEYKSLLKVTKGDSGFSDLARTCVCLANSHGGTIYIGYDDATHQPPSNQKIDQEIINKTISRIRQLCFNAGITASEIMEHKNGGQYFFITVLPSLRSIATTSDGKIFIRVGDECQPVRSEDIHHLAAEKDSFQWELITSRNIRLSDADAGEIKSFVSDIRVSTKTSDNVKNKTDVEILEYYNFIEVYDNRMEISNPGGLPVGITKDNILHQRRRRNPHLINVLHDLNLMEGEGSGYDMIYEVNSRFGKPFPEIISKYDSTKVIQGAKVNIKPSLITIESHRLQALIEEDLKVHPDSQIGEINSRLGDVPVEDLRKCIYRMVKKNILDFHGGKTYRKYSLAKK